MYIGKVSTNKYLRQGERRRIDFQTESAYEPGNRFIFSALKVRLRIANPELEYP